MNFAQLAALVHDVGGRLYIAPVKSTSFTCVTVYEKDSPVPFVHACSGGSLDDCARQIGGLLG